MAAQHRTCSCQSQGQQGQPLKSVASRESGNETGRRVGRSGRCTGMHVLTNLVVEMGGGYERRVGECKGWSVGGGSISRLPGSHEPDDAIFDSAGLTRGHALRIAPATI